MNEPADLQKVLKNLAETNQKGIESLNQAQHAFRNGQQTVVSLLTLMGKKTIPTSLSSIGLLALVAFSFTHQAPRLSPAAAAEYNDSMQAGMTALKAHDPADAARHFAAAAMLRPHDTTALAEQAYALFAVRHDEAALACCARMLSINGRTPRAHYIQGLVYKRQGNTGQALDAFRRASSYGENLAVRQIRILEECHVGTEK